MKIHKPQPTNSHNKPTPFIKPRPQLKNKDENKSIQAKLKVGSSNDKYEKEADQTADQVIDYSKSTNIGTSCPISSKPPSPESIQRAISRIGRDTPDFSNYQGSKVESKLASSRSKGSKMDNSTKNEMESGFGRDFNDVNIHTGSDAVQMNQELGAKAFTNGNDVYFNEGEYNPSSKKGKHLLAHELTHTVQQGDGDKMVQRAIEPEQVSEEMIGKGFFLDQNVTVNYSSGKVIFPKWQFVKIVEWDTTETKVRVSAFHKENNKKYKFNIRKNWITPYADKKPGLYKYEVGLDDVKDNIESGKKEIDDWKSGKSEYEKFGTMDIYNAQLENLESLQAKRYEDINKKLIQESMYNDFDVIIKKWTDYYNKSIGKSEGWTDLDANLVKSMIFQESQMGTAGVHLLPDSDLRYEGDVKSRYNLMQSIDSSGAILTLMMNDMDSELANRHKIDDVTKDLNKDKKRLNELDKLKKSRELNDSEQLEFNRINNRVTFEPNRKKRYWDNYYWTDNRFYSAWKEFNAKPTGKDRNIDYDFWVRAGIRWLFKKREKVSSWSEAIKAYNGSGGNASYYRNNVVTRTNKAKTASASNQEFKPKLEY